MAELITLSVINPSVKVAFQLNFPEIQMPHLFSLGQVVVTRNCLNYAQEHGVNLTELVERHVSGDGGDLCKADQQLNNLAIKTDGRVFSSYTIDKTKLYVITESDRSYTTVMLAEDY